MYRRCYALYTVLMGLAAVLPGCGDDGNTPVDAARPDAAPVDAGVPDAAPPDAAVAPVFRNPVVLPDAELATQALQLLGALSSGEPESCNECHALTQQNLRHWRALSDQSMTACLTDLSVSSPATAMAMLDCLRAMPGKVSSPFQTARLGIFSTAAELDWFVYVFQTAYGRGWEAAYADFRDRVTMPRGEHEPLTQAEFDVVAEWFVRGLPLIDESLPNDPPPTDCTAGISTDVAAYVAQMQLTGWGAVNAENNILMFGCQGASQPRECLSTYPRAAEQPYGTDWEVMPDTVMRVLRENDYSSSYWTRSSADGRFVAHGSWTGGGFSARFVDLVSDRAIPANALYDPSFFPDNSGFIFQDNSAHVCEQRVLTSSPTEINFNEPGCTSNDQVGLYQHVGAALGGGDYWSVNGQFVDDDGGHSATLENPRSSFSASSRAKLTPMVHTGSEYLSGTPVYVPTPFEGDTVIYAQTCRGRLLMRTTLGLLGHIETAVRHRVDVWRYLYDVLVKISAGWEHKENKPGFSERG